MSLPRNISTSARSTPPTTPGTTPGGSLSREDMKRLIRLGKERRAQEQGSAAAAADASRVAADAADEEAEETDEAKAVRLESEKVSKNHYIALVALTGLFVSLPLSEPKVDYNQVALFGVVNAGWILLCHANTYLHMATFALLNMLLVQWSAAVYRVPELVATVPRHILAGGAAGNGAVALAAWLLYVRKLPSKKRANAWDLILCALIFANGAVLVAVGVIPMRAVYLMFRSITGLLANFQLPDDVTSAEQ
jgi:hypothetical protein